MKKSIFTVLFTLFVFFLVSAQEDENVKQRRKGPPSIKQLFKDLDSNKDGKISKKEVKGPLKKDFKKIDLNEDGFLTKEEIKKSPKPKRRESPMNKK